MKILMITPDSYMIDRRIILEAKSLVEAGHEVSLLGGFECREPGSYVEDGIQIYRFSYDWDDERLKRIRRHLPNNDRIKMFVNRCFMAVANRFFERNPFEEFMYAQLMCREADIIQVHDLPCLKVGVMAARKKKIPIFYDAHEIYYAQDVLSPKQQAIYKNVEKKYIKRVDESITVNPFISQLMAKRYGITPPMVLMNCAELPSHSSKGDILREEANIPSSDKVVLYQGWISSERNIGTLVESTLLWSKNIWLVLIGYGDYAEELKRVCGEKGLDRVVFLGEKPSTKMADYTMTADLGVIPYEPIDDNHLYCSPNKLFEYIVSELPFICNSLPFLDYIRDTYQVCENCRMGDPESIAKAVAQVLKDDNNAQRMKENCREAAKVLNWDVEGQKLVKLYRKYAK